MVINCTQELVRPTASVATKTFCVVPIGKALPEGSPEVCITDTPGQLSLMTGGEKLTMAWHIPASAGAVTSPGQLMAGNSISDTEILKLQDDVLPEVSVVTNVLTVTPLGNAEPEGSPVVCTIVSIAQLSFALIRNVAMAWHTPGSVCIVILAGQVTSGSSLSNTETRNVQVSIEHPLSAITWTVVVPTLKEEPVPVPAPAPDVAPLKT